MSTGTAEKWNRNTYSVLRKLIYSIAAAQFWYGIYFDVAFVYPPKNHVAYYAVGGFGGKLRYLTVIGAVNTYNICASLSFRIHNFHKLEYFYFRFVRRLTIH